jgi:hypothetical protein
MSTICSTHCHHTMLSYPQISKHGVSRRDVQRRVRFGSMMVATGGLAAENKYFAAAAAAATILIEVRMGQLFLFYCAIPQYIRLLQLPFRFRDRFGANRRTIGGISPCLRYVCRRDHRLKFIVERYKRRTIT